MSQTHLEDVKEIENEEKANEDHNTTFSKIEFDKHNLFIRTLPNVIGFDKVTIINKGTTCVYFKWQKQKVEFKLEDKKSEGIDRFFCHYSDSKIFPGETKDFVFSFFSEKNGLFSEDWFLATSPPLKNCELNLHINGMVHLYIDKYSHKIEELNRDLERKGMNTAINEFVMDIVESVKPNDPPLPDMNDNKTFKFYFELLNKDYNIHYSSIIMKKLLDLKVAVDKENNFWNGSIEELFNKINNIQNEEEKQTFTNKLNIIIHESRRLNPEDSPIYNEMKNYLLQQLDNFNDIINEVREEYLLPPKICDWLTKESLSEQELAKYKADLKKKDDDYIKKAKKKPFKNQEEEQQEQAEYNNKISTKINELILQKCSTIEEETMANKLKEETLRANIFNEEYVDRLMRVKTLRNVKNEGGIDNKYVVLRIDIESYKKEYENKLDEEGNVIGQTFKGIDFLDTKDKMMDSLNYLLNNGVKAVLLLVDFGPKFGKEEKEYSIEELRDYIEQAIDHPTFFAKNVTELMGYNQQMDDEELKDNCCILMENINFFMEENSIDLINDEIVNPHNEMENISLYRKNKFLKSLTEKTAIYINDSVLSFDKYYPTIIDLQVPIRIIGSKIDDQLRKITDFFSIESENYLLIVGDNDVFRTSGRSSSALTSEGSTYILPDSDLEAMITNLLIVNSIMVRFKEIFIFGQLALQFIQFLRKDYTLFDNSKYKVQEKLFQLMKYILVKARLYKIKITLPEDFKILEKNEYQKHTVPYVDQNGYTKNYTKEIKLLLKREAIQRRLEGAYTDEEELNDNADYIRVKLEPEQLETLKLYKEKTVRINRLPYCFDIVEEFIDAQNVSKPKKMFKTPMDVYLFNESIYDKEIVYPEEIITSSEIHIKKEEKRLQAIKDEEEELKRQQEEQQQQPPEEPKSPTNKEEKKEEEKKEEEKNEEENKEEGGEENKAEEKKEEEPPKKKRYDPRIFNYDEKELVDYGEKSYEKLINSINTMNGIMWLGKLSPNKVENVFDNYQKILECIHQRKKVLKEKFEIEQVTQAKKLNETELKARKQLLNVLLKSNSVYEIVKDNFKNVLNNNPNPTVDELMNDEEEEPQDEEQFSHDMHVFIDYYINDDFELINSILKGKHLAGFYGVNTEKPIVKEEEFDPKILEEITN